LGGGNNSPSLNLSLFFYPCAVPDNPPTVLFGDRLTKRYGGRSVVRGVNVRVLPGEIVGLLGRNGAGKSTTFKMLAGLVPSDGGEVWLDGKQVTALPMHRRARLGLGYLAQEPTIFAKLSVEDNLRIVLENSLLTAGEQKSRLEELLSEFGLGKVRSNLAGRCSGGERRRLEIARTLINEPKVILLDEPFAGVDPIAVEDLRGLVSGLVDRGVSILLTDHNVREVLPMTHRSYIIVEGQVIKEGAPRDIANDEIVRKEYLGERFKLDEEPMKQN
jgi:lipopolysaccharide export system ATP-binding protein